jgi:hypothetical protein
MAALETSTSSDKGASLPGVLMIGTGEYTTGYINSRISLLQDACAYNLPCI